MGEKYPTPQQDGHKPKSDDRVYRVDVVPHSFDWRDGLYVVYILVTAIAGFIAYRALLAIRDQGRLMKDQLIEIRKTRQRTVAEMQGASIQTQELINQATRNTDALVRTERPWLLVTLKDELSVGIETGGDQPSENIICFDWVLDNHGRTPAVIYEVIARLDALSESQVTEICEKGIPKDILPVSEAGLIIAPDHPYPMPAVKLTNWIQHRVAIISKQSFLVAYGIVRYRDTITYDPHQAPFIGYWVFLGNNFRKGEFRRLYPPGLMKYTS